MMPDRGPQRLTSPQTLGPTTMSIMDALSPRAVGCGIVLGCAVCFANMYFGLQAGTVNAMPMQSTLLGFALFRSIRHRLSKFVTPMEVTTIEIVAGALGLAPFTSGFTGLIPALEFLSAPKDESPPPPFSAVQLLLWSLAVCSLGIVVAAPLRPLFILRDQLRFPSATATGSLIGALFGRADIIDRADKVPNKQSSSQSESAAAITEPSQDTAIDETPTDQDPAIDDVGHAVKILIFSLAFSGVFSLISYFIPVLRNVPLFGLGAAEDWLWALDLSPAYFGYGIIIGPSVNAYSMLGAVVGWGILSPMAKYNGWAPGPVRSWDNGSRGWIVWVAMALILGDSIVGLLWITGRSTLSFIRRSNIHWQTSGRPPRASSEEQSPLLGDSRMAAPEAETRIPHHSIDDSWPEASITTTGLILKTSIFLLLLYFGVMFLVLNRSIYTGAIPLVVALVPFAGFISMRSLGETDNGAGLAIARLAQFLIGLVVPTPSPQFISTNLLLGGVVEAGASQASQHMGGLKTAHMTRTPPRAVFFGQMIGSFMGAIVATIAYRIYTTVKTIPSQEFELPDGQLWLFAARLFHHEGLPTGALEFATVAFFIGSSFSILRILGSDRWWSPFIPSSVAVAIGMYIVPAITLARFIGSLILVIGTKRFGINSLVLMCSATGLILGQGLFSLIALLLDAMKTPHL